MRIRSSFKRALVVPIYFVALLLISTVLIDFWVVREASSHHTDVLESVPHHSVALVLGCAKYVRHGRINPYFLHRVNAAAQLYQEGKCDFIIVSGDNSRVDYNEPEVMRKALVHRGVPDAKIVSDFAGFRTLDSVVRAKEIFSQEKMIVVSQRFHNERAIVIGEHHGIEITGFNALDVSRRSHTKTWIRERLARVKTVLDLFLIQKEPKFLGPKETIPERQANLQYNPANERTTHLSLKSMRDALLSA